MTGRFPAVEQTAAELVRRVLDHPATLGAGRLLCVDGPAGSGKTTLAAALDRGLRDALPSPGAPAGRPRVRTVHMDDLYPGWSGLEAGMRTLASSVVAPLRDGRPGRYRRWDWHRDGFAEERVVDPVDVLVVEGVGSGCAAVADAVTCLVWVSAPGDVRRERGTARDGEGVREHWAAWQRREAVVLARERTRERADVRVDGGTGLVLS